MEFNFKVSEKEVNVILKALGELPARESMEVIGMLQMQANEQVQALQKPKESAKKEEGKK